jgi:acyl-CoA synthetase
MSLQERSLTDGRIQAGTEVRIVDTSDDDRELPIGEEGDILVRGPELFEGYAEPALNAVSFVADGWFRTGDVGRLDTDGNLTITDRRKDIIIRGGENISSQDVESVLIRHPAVQDAAVVAMPDERYGEKVCAFIVLSPLAALDLAEVSAFFEQAGVAKQKTPEAVYLVSELPRTPSGKVKKAVLRAQAKILSTAT